MLKSLPQPGLKLLLGIETTEQGILFLARHWGLLLFLVGALLVYSAFVPAIRFPVMIVAMVKDRPEGPSLKKL